MQLDTEDGETFVPPAGVVASPSEHTEERNDSQAQHDAEEQHENEADNEE